MKIFTDLTNTRWCGAALVFFSSYILFAIFTVAYKGEFAIDKIIFAYAIGLIGPIVAIPSLWYASVGIAVFAACSWLLLRVLKKTWFLASAVALVLAWVLFGIMCFTITTGGA